MEWLIALFKGIVGTIIVLLIVGLLCKFVFNVPFIF